MLAPLLDGEKWKPFIDSRTRTKAPSTRILDLWFFSSIRVRIKDSIQCSVTAKKSGCDSRVESWLISAHGGGACGRNQSFD